MTITFTREEAKQVLDAFETIIGVRRSKIDIQATVGIIRARLAQPDVPESCFGETEPVAWAEEIIDDLHACYNTEMIKEMDSGDELIRLDMAIAAVEEAAERQTATPQHNKPVAWNSVPSIAYPQLNTAAPQRGTEEPAAELRRLHEVNTELVEALQWLNFKGGLGSDVHDALRRLIAKATGEQHV